MLPLLAYRQKLQEFLDNAINKALSAPGSPIATKLTCVVAALELRICLCLHDSVEPWRGDLEDQ